MKSLTRSGLCLCLVLGCTSGAVSPGQDDASLDTKESGSGGSSSGGAIGSGGATASGGNGSGGAASGGNGGNGSGGAASGGNGGKGSGGAASGGSGGKGPGGAPGTGGTNGTGGATGTGGAGGGAAGGRGGGAGGSGGEGGGSNYMPCPTTAGTACSVLPLGDSITEGCCTAPEGGYRIELFRQAVTNTKNLTFVGSLMNGPTTLVAGRTFPMRHEGHGGYTISGGGNGGIAGTITDTAISTYHPNIVLLMIGTNDLNDNIDVTNAPSRLGKLIDEIITDAPSALVVVSTIIPISAPNGDQRTQTYNAALPALVNARASAGKHVVLVDNYAAFAKDPNYQTTLKADGLHPNTAGYVVLGQAFYGAIGALLPAGP